MRQQNELLEDRPFEIVPESNTGEFLRRVIDTRQRPRVFPASVSPRRRHAELGFQQQELEIVRQRMRADHFAATPTNRRGACDEKGNVRAKSRGKIHELRLFESGFENFIETEQRAGRVATPPTQTGAMRNLFLQRDLDSRREVRRFAKKSGCPDDEILFPTGQGRIVAGEMDFAIFAPLDRQPVGEGDRRDQRFDLVKSVWAPALDLERKIDFRRRPKLHILQIVHQAPQNNRMKSPLAEKIIVALDVATRKEALKLMSLLSGAVGVFKIGLQRYTADGPALLRAAHFLGPVFLDLKLHDIPNTVAKAVESADKLGVKMLTLHLSGGSEMVRAAIAARKSGMWLLGVTVLTSSSDETLKEIGVSETTREQVLRLARLGVANGIDGLVASPQEARMLRGEFGDKIKIVTPGIRPTGSDPRDQKRFATPREAVDAGADYLVIGRPITDAADPKAAVARIVEELSG
jgi:orotidine-5'-phosphate decarboxylase